MFLIGLAKLFLVDLVKTMAEELARRWAKAKEKVRRRRKHGR